ncbi:hypothetical protein ACH4GK_42105 [Streptomyces rimosus]|uniref:hypothetical protein n=1 Tax=Streptomyces rimosus TaxID=1927 RepID=UPI0004C6770C|nr:hypothetical protein [Streptomyces rimosus]
MTSPRQARSREVSHPGTVNVTADLALTHAVIMVSTGDDEGTLADAVRSATKQESRCKNLDCVTIRVPEVKASAMTVGSPTYWPC